MIFIGFSITLFFSILELCRKLVNVQSHPSVEEWTLAYSPKNSLLGELIGHACADLNLEGCFGLENSTVLEATVSTRKIVAGIEFHHAEVSVISQMA